ncbi:MAG: YigZ family protein [Bacteroidales bacterium]|nr:YigZ family protein [Bacteroidales bacterium]
MFDDTYRTIGGVSSGIYKEKGSKFLAFAEPAANENEAKAILEKYRKQYHDARHHCFAWAIGPARESQRMNDDGEPSGTAGRPIFGQILSFDLTDVIVVVVRYFGGTKLGVGGLINAYKSATKDAFDMAEILTRTINEFYEIVFPYTATNEVMRVVKEKNLEIIESSYTDICRIVISVRKKNAILASDSISSLINVKIKYLRTI